MQSKQNMARVGATLFRCVFLAPLFLSPIAGFAEPLKDGEVTLDLVRGAGVGGDMKLTLVLDDTRWDAEAWGRAVGHNFGQHPGQVSAAKGATGEESLNVLLTVVPDTVGAGGRAEYSLRLRRRDNLFEGRFDGVFCDEPVSGAVRGVVSEALVKPVAGFRPPEHEEHPRMVFRKADMPELRRRMETPEGKAMMAMLTARAPLRMPSQVTDRHASWMAANWGAIYQLAGDREAAAEARRVLMEEVIAKPLPLDRDDIQQAPRLLGVALAYDLCFDAWDEPFRRHVAEFMFMTAEEMYRGYLESLPVVTNRLDPVPWRTRNAVRVACAGAAAMAVMDDADSSGKPIRDARRLAVAAERDLVEWLRDGVTGTGAGLEGPLQKSIALANGVLAFMHAGRMAMGRDMSSVNPMLMAGYALAGRAAEDGTLRLGISSISVQASGRWPMGFAAIPDSLRGPMRWLYDRDAGLAGKQHFDCAYPYQAAYALVNYPFDTPAKEPGQGLPLFVADMRHGNILFRNRWQDSKDIVAVLEFNAMSPPGIDARSGQQAGAVRISGLGGEWVNGVVGLKPANGICGGEMLYAVSERAGQAAIGARLDPAYAVLKVQSSRRVEKPPDWGVAPRMRNEAPARPDVTDAGVRCTRHVGIDYSGVAGVPGLFVFVDQLKGAANRPWVFPASAGPRGFTVGAVDGANMTWQFAVPVGPQKVRAGSALPDGLCFAVATLQEGKAPELKVGDMNDSKVTVTIGGQTVTFTGERVVFGR